jgi:hypothetical protein
LGGGAGLGLHSLGPTTNPLLKDSHAHNSHQFPGEQTKNEASNDH